MPTRLFAFFFFAAFVAVAHLSTRLAHAASIPLRCCRQLRPSLASVSMSRHGGVAHCLLAAALAAAAGHMAPAQSAPPRSEKLQFVAIVSRHGVRSPTGKPDRLNPYSAKPWPAWSVAPGHLTDHGAKLMTLFGAYDRALYAQEGLFDADGCADADRVYIYDDSDQRTRETGKALAAGMFPGCAVEQHGLPEGAHDPIFHLQETVSEGEKEIALAAVSGRIGDNVNGLVEAYRPQLIALEKVLLGCAAWPCPAEAPTARSLFDIPASIAEGKDDHLVELHGPLETASTMAEDLLLEYTEGMSAENVGWGRVDLPKLRELVQLHTAGEEIVNRTPFVARAQVVTLLNIVLNSMRQAEEQKPVAGAMGSPRDRMLLIVGHDTNLANIAGVLRLNWLIDGRRDDTPPGSALVFELWSGASGSPPSVRVYFTSQTLDQMRNATPLTLHAGPERVPLFVPVCATADDSCSWSGFAATVQSDLSRNR